jgi:hypothetical protein
MHLLAVACYLKHEVLSFSFNSVLSKVYITGFAAGLPILSKLFQIWLSSYRKIWADKRRVDGYQTDWSLPPLSSRWIRSRAVMIFLGCF